VGVVTKPFDFEGQRRRRQADQGVAELEANVDSLIVILNEKLLEVLGDDVTQEAAFAQANDVLKNAVGGISDIIHMDALVNVDFEDVKTVMSEPGKAMMGTGSAVGPDRAKKAAEAAVACPLLEGIDLSGARGVLVLIAASRTSLKLRESQIAMDTIRLYAAEDATIIFGAAFDESLGDKMRVTVIATGRGAAAARRAPAELTVVTPPAPQPQPLQRTGTYDASPLAPATAHASPTAAMAPMSPVGLGAAAGGGAPTAAPTATDYGGLQVPSVWRSARTKVEALSGTGMDEIEIPAFLRKQAD
jgi:cell division protein FtsZ